jgi:hypothetical protein
MPYTSEKKPWIANRLGVEWLSASFRTEKLNSETRGSGQGDVRVQLLGDVPAAGLTSSEIAKKLARLYRV